MSTSTEEDLSTINFVDIEARLTEAQAEGQVIQLRPAEQAQQGEATEDEDETVATALRIIAGDLPLQGLVVPRGWRISATGIASLKVNEDGSESEIIAARHPVLVLATSRNAESGEELVELAWHDGRAWTRAWVGRGQVLNARPLGDLASKGVPSSSNNAKQLVRWFESYLSANAVRCPRTTWTARCGWRESGGFMLPSGMVGGDPSLTFRSEALQGLVGGYVAGGTRAGWDGLIKEIVASRPGLYLALLAASATPLLKLLPGAKNFVLEWAGKTSGGKTTALRLAASVWGRTEEGSGLIRTWNASWAWIERYAATSCDLPLLLDDTKSARSADLLRETVYCLSQGQGAGRGTVTGVQEQATWRTILLSTGEEQLHEIAAAGGASVRVLSVYGSPLGASSADNAVAARRLTAGLASHYGHLGPAIIAALQDQGRVEALRKVWAQAQERWGVRAGGDAILCRVADYLALLECSAWMLKGLGVPQPTSSPLELAWEAAGASKQEGDRETLALRDIWSWTIARESSFLERGKDIPAGGWVGRWPKDNTTSRWEWVGYLRPNLAERLKALGYHPDSTLKQWKAKGWLKADGTHIESWVRLPGTTERVKMVTVHRAALEGLGLLEMEQAPLPSSPDQPSYVPF